MLTRGRDEVGIDSGAVRCDAVAFDQMRFYSLYGAGNPTNFNPDYGEPTAFQLPASVRLGVEVGF